MFPFLEGILDIIQLVLVIVFAWLFRTRGLRREEGDGALGEQAKLGYLDC